MHHFISAWESLLGRWRATWCLLMPTSSTPAGIDCSLPTNWFMNQISEIMFFSTQNETSNRLPSTLGGPHPTDAPEVLNTILPFPLKGAQKCILTPPGEDFLISVAHSWKGNGFSQLHNLTENGREDGAWWPMVGALRANRMELESWLGPETYLTSLTRSFFIWIGKVMMAFSPVGCGGK